MAIEPYWAIQPAFTGGEISGDVASRVDLDNYENFSYRIGKMQLVESTVGENDVLYTGDLTAGLALGGYNTEGRVYIEHGTPYPFHLSAIIRKVSMHG